MTADPTSTVQVRYSPVERIRVEAMALNTTWQVRVGAWEGLLHSPRSRKAKRTWRFFAPDHFVEEERGRATIASHARRADGIEVHDWWFELPAAAAQDDSLDEAAARWFDRVCAWVSAVTGQHFDSRHPVLMFDLSLGRTKILNASASFSVTKIARLLASFTPESGRAIAAAEFDQILNGVLSNKPLPLQYEILNSARDAQVRQQWRRVVVDCGTALEIALERHVRVLLTNGATEQAVVEALLEKYRMLSGRVDLARRLDSSVPSLERLVKLRNRSVHGGFVPTAKDAADSINQAETLIQRLTPVLLSATSAPPLAAR